MNSVYQTANSRNIFFRCAVASAPGSVAIVMGNTSMVIPARQSSVPLQATTQAQQGDSLSHKDESATPNYRGGC